MEGQKYLNSLFFVWWYTELYHRLVVFTKQYFVYLADLFSVKICLKTLFSPWHRDSIGTEGLAIQDRLQVLGLNLVSRFFGAFIKIFTIFTYLIFTVVSFILALIGFLIWFFYPFIIIALIVFGIEQIIFPS